MDNTKKKIILESVVFACAGMGVALSVTSLEGVGSTAQLLGLTFTSFAAGAALTSLIATVKRRREAIGDIAVCASAASAATDIQRAVPGATDNPDDAR